MAFQQNLKHFSMNDPKSQGGVGVGVERYPNTEGQSLVGGRVPEGHAGEAGLNPMERWSKPLIIGEISSDISFRKLSCHQSKSILSVAQGNVYGFLPSSKLSVTPRVRPSKSYRP